MLYSPFDEVVLKVKEDFGYEDKVDVRLKVMVLGSDYVDEYMQYLCYIAPGETVPYKFSTLTISEKHVKPYAIERKFVGETGCIITSQNSTYEHIKASTGAKCSHCGIFVEGAKSKFNCRACTENPYR